MSWPVERADRLRGSIPGWAAKWYKPNTMRPVMGCGVWMGDWSNEHNNTLHESPLTQSINIFDTIFVAILSVIFVIPHATT